MCNFFSCVATRDGKVLWDAKETSHEKVIAKFKLKDDKLADRDFVRLELVPKGAQVFGDTKEWEFKIDEEGTLPAWFVKTQKTTERAVRNAATVAMKPYAKNLRKARTFVGEIPKIRYCKPDGKPKPEWKLFTAPTLGAARGAALDAALDAAWGAALDAARDAAWGAAWGAARDAARDAARGAALDAARGAALDATRDAARDAQLYIYCLLVADKIDAKHLKHAEARMEVWCKGYCLYCDVGGVLYVYAKKQPKRSVI